VAYAGVEWTRHGVSQEVCGRRSEDPSCPSAGGHRQAHGQGRPGGGPVQDRTTILKDNLSWHLPFLSANTTPWQLEGTILGLRKAGFNDLVAVHNNTVVTDPFKGGRLNRLAGVYRRYGIQELYNFLPRTSRGRSTVQGEDAGPGPDLP